MREPADNAQAVSALVAIALVVAILFLIGSSIQATIDATPSNTDAAYMYDDDHAGATMP